MRGEAFPASVRSCPGRTWVIPMDYDVKLDAMGMMCPMPIVELSRKIKELEPGTVLLVEADDEGVIEDIPLSAGAYDAVVLAVAHRQYAEMGAEKIHALGRDPHVLYDVKQLLPADKVDGRL